MTLTPGLLIGMALTPVTELLPPGGNWVDNGVGAPVCLA